MRFLTNALLLFVTALCKTVVHVVVVFAEDEGDVDVKVDTEDVSVNNDGSNNSSNFPRTTSVDFLRLKFQPAVLYQQTLHQEHDKLYFVPAMENNTVTDDGCWYQCIADHCHTLCGGTFTIDYSDYEVMEFSFVFEDDTLLRPSASDPRIRVAMYAQAVNCTNGELLLSKFVRAERINYAGRNVSALVDNYDPDKSFVQITRCSIATKLEFIAPDDATMLEANVTSITWKIALDNARVRLLGRQTYFFDTSMPLWIEVPSGLTNFPTAPPTATLVPTRVVVLSKEDPTARPDGAAAASSSGGDISSSGGSQKWSCIGFASWTTKTTSVTLLALAGWYVF